MMKIVYLTDQLAEHGGIEKIVSQKINQWIQSYGYEVILITYRQQNRPFIYPVDAKVQHVDLGMNYQEGKSYFSGANLMCAWKHYHALGKALKANQPDVIISASFTPDQYFLPFLLKDIPKIKELHASGYNLIPAMTGPKRALFNLLQRYDRLVVLNPSEAEYYPGFPVTVVPNFIDDQSAPPIVEERRQNILIAAGRIAPVKQFDHLIRAWAIIGKGFPEWQVHIYGEGSAALQRELSTLISSAGLGGQVKLMGGTSVLGQKMAEASLFGMTSATECFPMVLLEAQQAGLVVVSYRCPHGPENILHHNVDGILTQYNDYEQYAGELAALIRDKEKMQYLAQNARSNARQFTAGTIMARWNELIQGLVKNDKTVNHV